MAEPINSEMRLFELNQSVKCGDHFEISLEISEEREWPGPGRSFPRRSFRLHVTGVDRGDGPDRARSWPRTSIKASTREMSVAALPIASHQHDVTVANNGAGPMLIFDNGDTRISPPPLGLGYPGCEPNDCNSRGMVLTVNESALGPECKGPVRFRRDRRPDTVLDT
jgi:hypothetical protein